jgi:cbb3-type cytochrome oxidase subunit 3
MATKGVRESTVMAQAQSSGTSPARLEAENRRLRAENKQLKQQLVNEIPAPRFTSRFWYRLGSAIFLVLAVALLVTANLLLWAGNTVVKPDRFNATVTPIIKDPVVQTAVASYTTNALYDNVNVEKVVSDALPPRAEFLAPTISKSLQGSTESTLKTVLARPQFQERWNALLTKSHERFIASVEKNGSDGTIDINEVYQQLDDSLVGTKLGFLANRKLPSNVGKVQVASGSGISTLHRVVTHIDTWRLLALLLFVVCGGLSIFMSWNRRRGVLRLALFSAAALFITLIAIRITREIIASKAQDQYAEAVRRIAQIILHPLAVQTATILVALLVIAVVAWLVGPGRYASVVRDRVRLLFAGKLHGALFGQRENVFTIWVGAHKHIIEWFIIGVIAILLLVNRLTIKALVAYLVVALLLVLVVELLGAPERQPTNGRASR